MKKHAHVIHATSQVSRFSIIDPLVNSCRQQYFLLQCAVTYVLQLTGWVGGSGWEG